MERVSTSERLNYIMNKNKLKQIDILNLSRPFCDKYNVKMNKSDISQYVSGKVEPSQEKLVVLGMALKVTESWLMGFDVPMERKDVSGTAISVHEYDHVKKYRNLDKQGRLHVDTVLGWEMERVKELSRQNKQDAEQKKETPPLRIIQYYQRLASAGKGEYLFDDIPTDTIKVWDTSISRKADFVIGINGNSMEPDYHDGEKVFVEKTTDLEIGEVGIFVCGEECFIKELGKNGLISRNKGYQLITPSEDTRIIGKVLGKVEEYNGQ